MPLDTSTLVMMLTPGRYHSVTNRESKTEQKQSKGSVMYFSFCLFSVSSDLRSQVLWCSTEGLHGGSVGDAFFAEAKVGDLDVAVFVQHEVLQLKRNKKLSLSNLHAHDDVFLSVSTCY